MTSQLNNAERVAIAVIGIVAGAGAISLLRDPPQRTEAGSAGSTVIEVDADVQLVVIALLAIAGLTLLIAALGVRFNKLTIGEASAEVTSVVTDAPEEPKAGTASTRAAPQPMSPDPDLWGQLPDWAQDALTTWYVETSGSALPLSKALMKVEKEAGRGNKALFVTVVTNLERTQSKRLRVATGRGSAIARPHEPRDGE